MKTDIPSMIHGPVATRRQMITGMVATLGGLAAGLPIRVLAQEPSMQHKSATSANDARTSLHDDVDFHVSPQRIYDALLDAKQFAAFSGQPAEIDPKPGGAFSLFGTQIVGRTIELISNQRIVQAWRPVHWKAGVYSIVRFELKPRGSESSLAFDHTGFPTGEFDHLEWGWRHHYWEPLTKFLG